MKIELDIPDWCGEFSMYLMHGVELVAIKHPWEKEWKVKTGRCHQCGKCCTGFKIVSSKWPDIKNGTCVMLVQDGIEKWVCSLGADRPFSCSVGVNLKNREKCTEKFEIMK